MKNLDDEVQLSTPKGTMVFTKQAEVDNWTGDVNVFEANNNILNILPLKVGISANVDITPESGLEVIKESITGIKQLSGKNLVDSIKLKQNITDDELTTTAKTIVGAINEVFTDVNSLDDEITQLQNDLKGVNSDIDALKFQNFDITFHSLMTSSTNQTTKLMGKITIGLGSLFQSVWSITSRPTSGFEVHIQDLGDTFHCYKINGVIDNSVKYVTGTWSGDNFLINNFHGYEVEEPDENTYKIYFYDDVLSQQAVLSLNITPLKNSVNDNPKEKW